MAALQWRIVHECDDEDGNPTQWSAEFKRFANKTEILANYSFRTIASALGKYGAM